MENSKFICKVCEKPNCILVVQDCEVFALSVCPYTDAIAKWEVCEEPPNNTVEDSQAKEWVCECGTKNQKSWNKCDGCRRVQPAT